MGDLSETFKLMNERKNRIKAARLESADCAGWDKHTEYHWYAIIGGKRINYWPSTGLIMVGDKKISAKSSRGAMIINEVKKRS